jgi:hypothetical protein
VLVPDVMTFDAVHRNAKVASNRQAVEHTKPRIHSHAGRYSYYEVLPRRSDAWSIRQGSDLLRGFVDADGDILVTDESNDAIPKLQE